MPELPEVETIRRSIEPYLLGKTVLYTVVRTQKLRNLLAPDLNLRLAGQAIGGITRRGKYLLFRCTSGTLIVHLGMTGNMHLVPVDFPHDRHDHLDLVFNGDFLLRFADTRRFGTVIWTPRDPLLHPLLLNHGPEPLEENFSGDYLHGKTRNRRTPIKQVIMNSQIVAGIGNIYASEALFCAGIAPETPAAHLSRSQYESLVKAIREVLSQAIKSGTSSLRGPGEGKPLPGYFPYDFSVYGKEGKPCPTCGTAIKNTRLGGRSTFSCPRCQV